MALGWCGAKRPIVGASRRACFAPACAFVPRLLSAPFPPAFSLPSCPPRRQTLIYGRWARRGGPLCSLLLSLLSLAVSTVLIGVYSSSDRVYSSSDHGGVRDPTSCSHGPGKLADAASPCCARPRAQRGDPVSLVPCGTAHDETLWCHQPAQQIICQNTDPRSKISIPPWRPQRAGPRGGPPLQDKTR